MAIVQAARSFRFPTGIGRTISIDAERAGVHVFMASSGLFRMIAFRRPASPARVRLVLGRAARELEGPSRSGDPLNDVAGTRED